jgi:predicted lipid-binding transport protein (Tim44 family)
MSEGFAYIDILFFAMVAAFIALRLRSVLGRRTGHERRRSGGWGPATADGTADKVVALPERGKAVSEADRTIADLAEGKIKTGLTQIRLADQGFDLNQFLAGARSAFEMIVQAYAAGEKNELAPLLAADVLAGFTRVIDEREAARHTLETQLVAINKAEAADAAMEGTRARVTVRFTSEQVNVLHDAGGKIIEGDPSTAEEVVDLWTFERDTRSDDPNWILVETRTPS